MSNFLRAVLVFAILPFMAAPAQADILLEPYGGYYTGDWEQGTTSHDLKGLAFGGRLGFQHMGFMAGLDYMTGMWKDDDNPSRDVTPTDLSIFVGYNFPAMVRIYGAYGLDSELKFKANNTVAKWTGNTLKFGIGFTFFPMVSLNLETIRGDYDEVNGQSATTKRETVLYGFSVSVPLTF